MSFVLSFTDDVAFRTLQFGTLGASRDDSKVPEIICICRSGTSYLGPELHTAWSFEGQLCRSRDAGVENSTLECHLGLYSAIVQIKNYRSYLLEVRHSVCIFCNLLHKCKLVC